jgi:hypothetical protein
MFTPYRENNNPLTLLLVAHGIRKGWVAVENEKVAEP